VPVAAQQKLLQGFEGLSPTTGMYFKKRLDIITFVVHCKSTQSMKLKYVL
jgi:hypothetical protein